MCIIIAKTKIQKAPKISTLKECFENNPDGAGFMYVDNNKVIIDKGYMRKKDFINRYKYLLKKYNNFENKNLIIHCRISTSGQITKEYCHPYPITADVTKMKYTKSKCNIAIAHNGVLTEYNPKNKKTNDTMNFIKKYIYKKYKQHKLFNKQTKKEIKETGSKFAILTKNDKLVLIGSFIKDNNYFSNDSYKKYIYNYDNFSKIIELSDYTILNYEGYKVGAEYFKTKKDSILYYDYYGFTLYEVDKTGIVSVTYDVDIEGGAI